MSGMHDSLLPILDKSVVLSHFEGPLDLLLFLIRKNEIDIYDIPIESITNQYLKFIYQSDTLTLELAGEFFVMASTLMYIKSCMLIPSPKKAEQEEQEDSIDPRWELVEQLLAYKKYKELSTQLADNIDKSQGYNFRLVSSIPVSFGHALLHGVEKEQLNLLFNTILNRFHAKKECVYIEMDEVSVSERINYIVEYLQTSQSFLFSSLLPCDCSLTFLVATFLGVLELCRLKKVNLRQLDTFEDIECFVWDESFNFSA